MEKIQLCKNLMNFRLAYIISILGITTVRPPLNDGPPSSILAVLCAE